MLEVVFIFEKLLNTSLNTTCLVYLCFLCHCSLLKSLDKATYNWPLLGDKNLCSNFCQFYT